MRVKDILTEEQLDELSMGDIGRGIARGAGKVAGGVGSLVGGVKGTASGMKQSYTAARDAAYAAGKSSASPYDYSTPAGNQSTTVNQPPLSTPPASATQTATNPVSQTPPSTKPASTTPASQSAGKPAGAATAPSAGKQVQPTASPSTQLKAPPTAPGSFDNIKKMYSTLDNAEREQLKKELDILDDQDRLASGTNESLDDILKLAKIK